MMCLQSLLQLWKRLQVELHGQYSVTRFEALLQYQARHTSHVRALAIAILGPLPLLLLLISVDALPLAPISESLSKQTFGYWWRTFLIASLMPITVIGQTWYSVPVLPMSRARLWTITAISATSTCALNVGLILLFGFPLPFSIQLEAGPFLVILITLLWLCWKDTLKTDITARQCLKQHLTVVNAEVNMLVIYIGFNIAFAQLHGHQQTLLSCLLPPIKLFFKNCVSKGTHHLQDLSPAIVVFSVDIFHAFFVSFTTQQASSNGANIVVMAADVVQNCVAYYELSQVVNRIHALTYQDTRRASIASRRRASESSVRLTVSVIDYADYVLRTVNGVRTHPRLALSVDWGGSDAPVGSQNKSHQHRLSASSVSPSVEALRAQSEPAGPCRANEDARLLRHVECTKCVLKLMHMLEFYVLVEYVEAMLSFSYGTFI